MANRWDNFAKGQVSGSHSDVVTTITLATGHGARFDGASVANPRKVVVWEASAFDDPADAFNDSPSKAEILHQTGRSGDDLTVVRAQEGTSGLDMTDTSKTYFFMGVPTEEFFSSQIAWTNVLAHGATGDGVTDDTAAVIAALDAVGDGGIVYFPTGNYDLATWPSAGQNYAKRLKLIGEGESILTGPSGSHFLDVEDDVIVENLEFAGDWEVLFELDSVVTSINLLKLRNIRAVGTNHVIRWDTPNASGAIARIVVEDSEILSTEHHVVDVQGVWGSLEFRDNHVDGGTRVVSAGTDTQADEDDWLNVHIRGNTVQSLSSDDGDEPALCVVYGHEVVVSDNVLDGADSGTAENWGIYVKARRATIHDNIIKGVTGGSTGPTGIVVAGADRAKTLGSGAGPSGYNVSVRGNHVDMGGVSDSIGIQLLVEDAICAENTIEDCETAGITTLGDDVQLERVHILNNHVYEGAAGSIGIQLLNGGNHWHVKGNIVYNHEVAIQYAPTAASPSAFDPTDIQICGNTLIDGSLGTHGIQVDVDTTNVTGDVEYLQIVGNYVAGMSTAWLSFDAGTINVVDVRGNQLNGNASSDAIVYTVTPTLMRGDGAAWDGNHPILDGYHLWVDGTGDLRINSGAPANDTDGTVVGSQS